jgi:hypothetical protein
MNMRASPSAESGVGTPGAAAAQPPIGSDPSRSGTSNFSNMMVSRVRLTLQPEWPSRRTWDNHMIMR